VYSSPAVARDLGIASWNNYSLPARTWPSTISPARPARAKLSRWPKKRGRRAEIFRADLTKESEAAALVNGATKFLGGLDVLVNNAGDLVERRTIQEVDAAFWSASST